jgi:D-3-phosphoglycerate dehydrogenase
MKYRVLVTAPYIQPVLDRFRPIFREHEIEIIAPPVRERCEEEDLLAWVGDIDGAICGDDRYTERVLSRAPKLRVISKWGTGIDSIDKEACKRLGIALRNTPNAFSEPVADTVIGYMLAFARQLPAMDRMMKRGIWDKIPGRALRECTLGVIGVGNVGKVVVRRALGFGMNVLGNDIVEMPTEFLSSTKISMVSGEELLRRSDFVSTNCDLNPTSVHLMNDAAFGMMKSTAILINTARGPIVEEAALIRALQSGRIAGAALDVFEVEPLPAESPLMKMENVFLAPHNSNSSPEAWERVHQNTVNNLLEELERNPR